MSDLVVLEPSSLPATVQQVERDRAKAFALADKAPSTRKAYRTDYSLFVRWCGERALAPMPATPEVVAQYIAFLADNGLRSSSIGRKVAALRHAHKLAGVTNPPTNNELVRVTMRGIRRELGTAPVRKAALTHKHLGAMLEAIGTTRLVDLRDRAILGIAFAAALRRSEVVALNVEDIEERPEEGILVHIRRSKTDGEGGGCAIPVLTGANLRPVALLREWLAASGIQSGPLFVSIKKGGKLQPERLSDRHIADLVKVRAAAIGLDPTQFSGHSMRAGFVTSAAVAGASIFKIQAISRHKSVDVLSGYVRDAEAFIGHAGAAFL